MKTCIFIVGKQATGKSSIVRALTGIGREGFWRIKDSLWALVIIISIGERPFVSPQKFSEELEASIRNKKRRNDPPKGYTDYKLLICPIRPTAYRKSASEYILAAKAKNFDVKVAGIETDWRGNKTDLKGIDNWCTQNNIPYLALDTNNDYNLEASKLRQAFYPK